MTDDFERERRQQKRFEKLGTDDPRCGMCGEDNNCALELHHVAGRKHDDLTVILCANCHRIMSDDQRDHPVFDRSANDPMAAIGYFLLGLADMLRVIVRRLHEFGQMLIDGKSDNVGKVAE